MTLQLLFVKAGKSNHIIKSRTSTFHCSKTREQTLSQFPTGVHCPTPIINVSAHFYIVEEKVDALIYACQGPATLSITFLFFITLSGSLTKCSHIIKENFKGNIQRRRESDRHKSPLVLDSAPGREGYTASFSVVVFFGITWNYNVRYFSRTQIIPWNIAQQRVSQLWQAA